MVVILASSSYISLFMGFSSRLTCSSCEQLSMASISTSEMSVSCSGSLVLDYLPAMKFLLALTLRRLGISWRTGGSATKELAEMSIVSSWVQLDSSLGRAEILFLARFSSEQNTRLDLLGFFFISLFTV